MIGIYFSGTGNTKHCVEKLVHILDDTAKTVPLENSQITNILIFAAPIFYCLCGLRFTGIILCTVASVSACEELIITVKSKELDRDCKGILRGKIKIYKEKEVVQR